MTLAIRPLLAVLLLCLASGNASAKQKSAVASAPSACTDFYSNANQAWLRANPLPLGAQSSSRWDQLNASAEQQTRELLTKPQAGNPGIASTLLADLVASAQNQAGLDAAAHAAAQPLLAQIDAIRKPKDIAKVVASLHAAGVPVLFGFDVLRDPDNGQPRASFYPGGIGLPDPAYYASTEPELQLVNRLYAVYLRSLLEFSGVTAATIAQQADWAYSTEKSLAKAMGPDSRVSATVIDANKAYPALFLSDFMQAQGAAPEVVAIHQSEFFSALDKMMVKPSIPQWQAYLRAAVGRSLVSTMASDPRQPYLAAVGLTKATSPSVPVEDRLAGVTGQEASEVLSAAYAETYLGEARKQQATRHRRIDPGRDGPRHRPGELGSARTARLLPKQSSRPCACRSACPSIRFPSMACALIAPRMRATCWRCGVGIASARWPCSTPRSGPGRSARHGP